MEHVGEALKHIDMEARLTITNMAIEAGAKNGILEFDEVTREYLEGRAKRPYTPVSFRPGRGVREGLRFGCGGGRARVAKPMSPDNYAPLSEVEGHPARPGLSSARAPTRGSPTCVAQPPVLDGTKSPTGEAHHHASSHQVAIQAEREGLIRIFLAAALPGRRPRAARASAATWACSEKARFVSAPPTGTSRAAWATRRRWSTCRTRPVAAASAVTGVITHPREVLKKMPAGIA